MEKSIFIPGVEESNINHDRFLYPVEKQYFKNSDERDFSITYVHVNKETCLNKHIQQYYSNENEKNQQDTSLTNFSEFCHNQSTCLGLENVSKLLPLEEIQIILTVIILNL